MLVRKAILEAGSSIRKQNKPEKKIEKIKKQERGGKSYLVGQISKSEFASSHNGTGVVQFTISTLSDNSAI
jgi:hypothetical protein